MKNHINVFSKSTFYETYNWLDRKLMQTGAYICIHDSNNPHIIDDTENVLNVWFDDTDPTNDVQYPPNIVHFSEDDALKIKNFVNQNENANFWMIHCTAGICRSGAVGEVLSEFFQIPYWEFKQDNPQIKPNIHVKNLLKTIMQ